MIGILQYDVAVEQFKNIINEYELIIESLSYVKYSIKEYELAYLIEDSFIIYIGLIHATPDFSENYVILFEELSENAIFKFNINGFIRRFEFGIIKYKKFNGRAGEPIDYTTKFMQNTYEIDEVLIESKFNYVDQKIPQLHVKERYNSWEGFLYNFIIFEISKKIKKGYAICQTRKVDVHKVATKRLKDIRAIVFNSYSSPPQPLFNNIGLYYYENGIYVSSEMVDIIKELEYSSKYNMWDFSKSNLKYFILAKHIKSNNPYYSEKEILYNAINNKYHNLERYDNVMPKNKWKSEQLVYELTKKIFKNKSVIYQYRPYFLKTEHGQMSYDVFICGEDIAIEYQGKQHFEPVEIFGGEKSFKEQIKRDKLKKYLSDLNGIKLIYINYNDKITTELIKKKIDLVK